MIEHLFTSMQDLIRALAQRLIDLTASCSYSLTVSPMAIFSGGQTPQLLFAELAQRNPDWSALTLTLTDERCVAASEAHSNAGQLHAQLLSLFQHPPKFIDLLSQTEWLTTDSALFNQHIRWAVVGMGLDGHTASLFAEDVNIIEHLQSSSVCVSVAAAGNPKVARVSLTPRMLKQAQSLFLLIQGQDKWAVYQQAKADLCDVASMPIRALLGESTLEVYWTP
jgi:6-phosphogluconolactonase